MNDLVVRKNEDIPLTPCIGCGECHFIVIALAEQRIKLHVLEEVVHPAHVPLQRKAEAVLLLDIARNMWPRRRLLGDRDDARISSADQRVQVLEELDRLKVLVLTVLVRDPLAVLLAIIEVQHRRDRIDAETIDMHVLDPEERIRDQEVLDLRSAVIEDLRAPVRMLALARILVLILRISVEVRQSALILREMRRHPVEDDADSVVMEIVDHLRELLRRAVAGRRSEISRDLIAPGPVERMLRDAHELDVRVAHVLQIRNCALCELHVCVEALDSAVALRMLHPRSDMALVDDHRVLVDVKCSPLLHPLVIRPLQVGDVGHA